MNGTFEDYKLENIVYRKISEQVWLAPYDAERLFKYGKQDAFFLNEGVNDDDAQKYLEGISITFDYLKERVLCVESGSCITYLITVRGFPMGMFFLYPPMTNKMQRNRPIWTIEYFVVNKFRGKGIMTSCFPAFMKLMAKDIGIDEVYAWVHDDNVTSIGILEKFFFRKVDTLPVYDNRLRNVTMPHYLALKCPLCDINFYDTYIDCPQDWIDKPTLVYNP